MRPRPARSTPSTSGSDMARKGILLLSGGFDSPVAGRLMSRQGLGLVAAHFSLEPITDDAAAVKARTLCGLLEIGSLYVVRVGEAFAEVAHAANRRFYFILRSGARWRPCTPFPSPRLGRSFRTPSSRISGQIGRAHV